MKKFYFGVGLLLSTLIVFFSCKEKKKDYSTVAQLPEESSPVESLSSEQPAVESAAIEQLPEEHFTKEEVEQKLIAEGLRQERFIVDDEGKYYVYMDNGEDGITMVLCNSTYSGFDAWLGGYIFYEIRYGDVEKMELKTSGSVFSCSLTLKDGKVLKGTVDSAEEKHSFVYMEHKKKSDYEKRLERFEEQGIKENWYSFNEKKTHYSNIAAGKDYAYMTWGHTADPYVSDGYYQFPDLTEDDIEDASVVSSGSLFIGTIKTKDGKVYTRTFDTKINSSEGSHGY